MEDLLDSVMTQPLGRPKSILKKTSQRPAYTVPPNVNIPAPTSDKAARHLQTALSYAHEIQAQKALQVRILEHIEELSLIPDQGTVTPADVKTFASAVVLFQPSDYSALLEERNVNGLCGYTLCGSSPLPPKLKRNWKNSGEPEPRFCSTECARKAMYVRAQLNETPAWERRSGAAVEILLKEDDAQKQEQLQPTTANRQSEEQAQLALERSEQIHSHKVKLVTDDVVEKQTSSRQSNVGFKFEDLAHDSIEGFSISNERLKTIRFKSGDD